MQLTRTRLDLLSKRKIANLDVTTRQAVVGSLQRMGLFTDQGRRDELLNRTLSDLEPEVRAGLGIFLAQQELADRSLRDLEGETRESVILHLRQADALADAARVEGLDALHLSDLDEELSSHVREALADLLQADLAAKSMEELPAETRRRVHRTLDEQNYFVDEERAEWYERKTLAQLPSEILRDLEQHLGEIRYAELDGVAFREIPSETRDGLLDFLDRSRLFSDRAQRLRLVQGGTIGKLSEKARSPITQHFGRQWLVQLRNRRPPDLAPDDRETVWAFLRDRGYFADEFKEELFAYQRLDEFDAETRTRVETALVVQLNAELDAQPFGAMSPELRSMIRGQLREADYFVDAELLRQVEESRSANLPADLRRAVETALGTQLLDKVDDAPVAGLPAEMRASLWRYLDQVGYFVDEERRKRFMDRRLADLASESYEAVISDVAQQMRAEIGNSPVSDLEDDLRQGLRQALEELEYFTSADVRERVLSQPIGRLRREDLDALALELGLGWLESQREQALADLPKTDQEAIMAHLQAGDWFLDPQSLDRLLANPVGDLEAGVRQDLVDLLQRDQVEQLAQQPLASMDRELRRTVHQILLKQGLALEDRQMRSFRRQQLSGLAADVYGGLLREIGEEAISAWAATRFGSLDQEQQAVLSAYLGRMILGRSERRVLLHTISRLWIDYLTDIEDLRRGIGLEAYGQRDPLVEYKRRAFELFEELGDNIRRTTIRILFRQPPEVLSSP